MGGHQHFKAQQTYVAIFPLLLEITLSMQFSQCDNNCSGSHFINFRFQNATGNGLEHISRAKSSGRLATGNATGYIVSIFVHISAARFTALHHCNTKTAGTATSPAHRQTQHETELRSSYSLPCSPDLFWMQYPPSRDCLMMRTLVRQVL